jgi:hypothetical protein
MLMTPEANMRQMRDGKCSYRFFKSLRIKAKGQITLDM